MYREFLVSLGLWFFSLRLFFFPPLCSLSFFPSPPLFHRLNSLTSPSWHFSSSGPLPVHPPPSPNSIADPPIYVFLPSTGSFPFLRDSGGRRRPPSPGLSFSPPSTAVLNSLSLAPFFWKIRVFRGFFFRDLVFDPVMRLTSLPPTIRPSVPPPSLSTPFPS